MRILCRKTYYLDHWFTKKEKIFIKGKYYTGKYSSAQPHLSPIYSEHTWPAYKVIGENRVIFVDTDENDLRSIWFSLDSSKPNYFYKYFLGEKEIRLNKLKRVQKFVLLKKIHKFSIVLSTKKVKVWMQRMQRLFN